MKNKNLDYVVRHYRQGSLDMRKAYRRTLAKAGRGQMAPVRQWAVAAAVAVAVLAGGILWWRLSAPEMVTVTAGAENRTVALADGTRATLAPHATLAYEAANCRSVTVTGKVLLDIRHDASRPFTVRDADYEIRDIGTRLMIDERLVADGRKTTAVYVAEGAVSLRARQGKGAVEVTAGTLVKVAPGGRRLWRPAAPVPENITAWATRDFHFDGTPLPDVLRDLSACYHVALSCDPADADRRLTGDFHADSLATILDLIEETLDVKIEQNKAQQQ